MPKKEKRSQIAHKELIARKIYIVRDHKVMLDSDLADLYQVSTKSLNQAVKRNMERFPNDFMFRLTKDEAGSLRSQIVTLKQGQHIKYLPYTFTEPGVAMLSSVLNSPTAIQVNIQIIRTFINLREIAVDHRDLWIRLDELEKKYDQQFQVVFKAIKMLLEKNEEPPKRF
jgi:hypothetical protein